MEFRLREWNTGSAPRGISYMLSSLDFWMHGGDPLARLAFAAPLAALKTSIARGERPFEALIERWFLENPHRTTLVLRADSTQADQAAEERTHLDTQRSRMSAQALDEAVAWTEKLEEIRARRTSPRLWPPSPASSYATCHAATRSSRSKSLSTSDTRVFFHDLPTNGIVYADIGFDLHQLPRELLPFVRLFSRALLETGVGDEDFVALAERIGRLTGGIHGTRFVSAVRGSRPSDRVSHLARQVHGREERRPRLNSARRALQGAARQPRPHSPVHRRREGLRRRRAVAFRLVVRFGPADGEVQ